MTRLVIVLLVSIVLTACRTDWVQLTEAAEQVAVATPAEVGDCARVGTANVNAMDSIGFVQRSARQLQEELIRLARNEAGDMEASHVVVESPIREGRQTFGIYRCS